MIKRLMAIMLDRKTFIRGSGFLVATTIASYVLGLIRDRLLAQQFGATHILDSYNAAFIVPDLLLNIFVAGTLTAAFIPIFSDLLESSEEGRSEFVSSVLSGALLVLTIVGIICYLFAPQLAHIIVPGFDNSQYEFYVGLLRILLLSPLVFAISNTLGSILVVHERFFWYGMSAALYNLGIISGILFLSPNMGIYGVAWGAIIGAGLHLTVRLIDVVRYPLKYRLAIIWNATYRKFLKLMAPKMVGQPIEQFIFLGYTIIASSIGAGSIAILNFARNFQSFPVAVIGINFALAMFPVLSRASARNDRVAFTKDLIFTAQSILIVTSLAALGMYLLRIPIVSLLLGGGEFDADAVKLTASTLGVFTLAIPTESLNHLLARSFYSLKNSATPVIMSVVSLVIAIVAGYIFSKSMGVPGLALGFFVGSFIKVATLSFLLKKEIATKMTS